MNFSRFLDIQSWWEVPSIAYFCSLFRTAFNLLDFDIEELEEALLTDGTEESASSLLTELIVRLLNGCLGNNDISAFNYQMYLRRLFRRKCQETGRYNPFNTDIDFQFLPLRTKVEILYALCDFRLDAEDVFDLFKNLEAESLRVEPLGWDDNYSAYWYFYGTRLYREDIIRKPKGKNKKKKVKESRRRSWFYGDEWLDEEESERVWQVVCFTESDWTNLTEKFSKATSKVEKELYRSLSQNFLPEIPRLFQEKERLQRKRLLELAPRRTSNRVLQKIKRKQAEEEENKQSTDDNKEEDDERKDTLARENRAKRRNLLRSQSVSSDSSETSESAKEEMPLKVTKRSKSQDKRSKNSSATHKGEPPPEPPLKTGRKTNNSLASATGQIVIPDNDEPINSTRKKLKTSQIFSQSEEDIQTDMYKVLEQITAHEDAWPFIDPVEEEYAPNYYAVIRRPMDLHKMEERLDTGYYTDFSMFKADFKLIVNNCRLYNGQDNEYTIMVDNLQVAFDRLTEKYMHRLSSSDEEIAVEYQIPTPSRKHKLKSCESPTHHKRKKRKSHSESGEPKSSTPDEAQDEKVEEDPPRSESKKSKESHKNKEGKGKKKRKGHHRHGKHSKNHKKERSESKKHSKKHKEGKSKESKKSKQKKKKLKHLEVVPKNIENEVQPPTPESMESSNRSRSASPLPSIHTPTPSPTELDHPEPQPLGDHDRLSDPDFFKDKYDKIKERRRHAAKDAWDSLFDYKQKTAEKPKQNIVVPEKDKNPKLRETIEKLKAKNEKYKDSTIFKNIFSPGKSGIDKPSDTKSVKDGSNREANSDDDVEKDKSSKSKTKKGHKKNSAKNESASEALEEAVKDISKWFDDAPKGSTVSSPCDSPAQTISTEEHDNSRQDDEFSQSDKSVYGKKDTTRKRPSSREPKLLKRREIQRTIDRLQPGKSKGNLLTNISNKNVEKSDDTAVSGVVNKIRETTKIEESSPKLSLGSVLPTVEFTLGKDHKFDKESKVESQKKVVEEPKEETKETYQKEESNHQTGAKTEVSVVPVTKKDVEVETEPQISTKPNQEKATPNLSAWFKAFGAPKSTPSTAVTPKKKEDTEIDDKPQEATTTQDTKPVSPKNPPKYDSPTDPDTPNPDGGDSPLPSINATPRQRRTSTGSSVSERSSFSQDLDSPRHQMSHTSPLLRSPASPRTDDFQKITYPIINGSVRAGFYQDTTSIKSSPEKSCSPREAPQSPYSPYSQHVYASNNAIGSATPNYFVDHNKSPLPTYSQNPPPYYDTSKVAIDNKASRAYDEYSSIGADSYQQNQYTRPYSPAYSPYQQNPSTNYSQVQHSPQPAIVSSTSTSAVSDIKATHFPVKKRMYNEPEQAPILSPTKTLEKEPMITPNKGEFLHSSKTLHSVTPLSSTSVDDIALALSEKSELAKLREKNIPDYASNEQRNTSKTDHIENTHEQKKEVIVVENKPIGMLKKDNIDMVNMGYMNPDLDRRNSGETHDNEFSVRELAKANINTQQKVYDVDAIALNLGINNHPLQKTLTKNTMSGNVPHAHIQDRNHSDMNINQTVAHSHHQSQYDLSSGQTVSNFSISDIELANKKLYSCNATPSSSPIDYIKLANHMRKQEMMPSDYSTAYNVSAADKLKPDINTASNSAINYNKNVQHQQYNMYNVPRSSTQRSQELQQSLPSELRIPNPRGMIKNDHMNIVASSISEQNISAKTVESAAKSQKSEKLAQDHPLVTSNPYKTAYSNAALPLDGLRNLPNIPQMLERYTNEERFLSSFSAGSSSLYHEKQFQMAQMFNKSMSSEIPPSSNAASIYSQSTSSMSKDNTVYKHTNIAQQQADAKAKNKRKRTNESKPAQIVSQAYHTPCTSGVLSSVKSGMMPASAFNFGTTTNMATNMALSSSGLYGDNTGFSANPLMAANYMVAAVAHQQRNNVEVNAEKLVKPAHQNSGHAAASTFPFIGHSQVRGSYPFVGAEPSSPLYQQYLQRHQEELLRQTGAQIMSLYPGGYPASLSVRQPYDSMNMNRHSWL